jgi:hypothetical protein
MNYYDLLKQYVSTGKRLSEYQFDIIKNNSQLLNSYFYNRNKTLDYSLEKYEVEFVENNPKYFSRFDQNNLIYFMEYSSNPDEIAKMIIKAKGDKLDSDDIESLMKYSPIPYEMAKMIIKAKEDKEDKLDSNDIRHLLSYSYKALFTLSISQNPDELSKMIINAKGDKLDSYDIRHLLSYSPNPDELAKMIINAKGDKLYSYDIKTLLSYQNPYEIAKLIGMDKVNKYLYELDSNDIYLLLNNNKNPDELKKLLIQAGFDRRLIPESKKTIKKVLRDYIK